MEFKFGTINICELGKLISQELNECGITSDAELSVYVNKEHFNKIDEDLFYRNREDDKKEFIPSEGEIVVKIDNVTILIKEKD